MRPSLYTVDRPGPGTLSAMAKPRGGDWLDDEMNALRSCGVDVLVCGLTKVELDECGLAEEGGAASGAGLRFVAVPIVDRSVPDAATVLPVLRDLSSELRAGAHVVTHCRFGIGRACLLAAALLVLNGVDPETAWRGLERARGLAVPDTVEQRRWVDQLIAFRPR
ncbi:hypothetical protein [Streptosporangium carneum]|uniref:Tyrosine specific protein phosphatases domain-containing protein n=1 Tax=Streptosporangium carneum TaxID=47481 RepID=A0A9W6I407_9ACTN|nr:hypothetical protein [Streptosporangium carneum]GLK11641.1 hypothetical protein GCM10017600_50480 [Streptosporangium carneum]